MSAPQSWIVYPNVIAALGGAVMCRQGVRFSWVELPDGASIKMPNKALDKVDMQNGLAVAIAARAYAKAQGAAS